MNVSVNHDLIALDANITDLRTLIDQQRPEQKIYRSSICDLWLRLKAIEQMGPVSLITFLRKNQLYRCEKQLSVVNDDDDDADDDVENSKSLFYNPRRSRLSHCYIYSESDKFHFDIDSYVGLLLFSYDNQLKFVLNGHFCQRGDILIKQLNYFNVSSQNKSYREIYDIVFRWYFGRSIDQRFLGIGFLYVHDQWRFDLISPSPSLCGNLFLYEYRMFDMYLLTHWLLTSSSRDVREMEMNAQNILFEQIDIVKKKLMNIENMDLLVNEWIDFIGSDIVDLKLSRDKFLQTIEKEMENFFKDHNFLSFSSSCSK